MANPKIPDCIEKRTIQLAREDVPELVAAIKAACAVLQGGEHHVVYALMKDLQTLKLEHEAIVGAVTPADAFMAYERERMQLCSDHAVHEDGQPKLTPQGRFVIDPARRADFEKAIAALQAEHKDAIDAERHRAQGQAAFLHEHSSVDLFCFPRVLMPTKQLTWGCQMSLMAIFTDADPATEPESIA
jgi:hypothetical protein